LPADIVEEILRIDGLDNITIPDAITITPSVEENYSKETYKEKIANYLTGLGFNEIITNSITNAAYFSEEERGQMVSMLNSLSAELNILRDSLFETALEVVAHNLNHRNNSLRLFEFGKAYNTTGPGQYNEAEKLCLVVSGNTTGSQWKQKEVSADFYYLKGVMISVFKLLGIRPDAIEPFKVAKLDNHVVFNFNGQVIAGAGEVNKKSLAKFDIKQPVFFAGLNWALLADLASKQKAEIGEIPKFPMMQRDVAMIVPRQLAYEEVEKSVQKIRLNKLHDMKLFDIFESEKLGADKKSLAVSFTFRDEEKTLTDKEIDGWMNKIMSTFEKDLQAEIRK
jgi:phenylalanyl-tRNA synthetase beta chain